MPDSHKESDLQALLRLYVAVSNKLSLAMQQVSIAQMKIAQISQPGYVSTVQLQQQIENLTNQLQQIMQTMESGIKEMEDAHNSGFINVNFGDQPM